MTRRTMMAVTSSAAATAALPVRAASPSQGVVELRQYKIVPGTRDAFVSLFEREFVESQEALGMLLQGMFRDLDDPDRFVWIRQFQTMPERAAELTAFYTGPVWQAHRDEANPMLVDNDNVLLLTPAWPGSGLIGQARDRRPAGLVAATIHYLWKEPSEGFTQFFKTRLSPVLSESGLSPLGAYVRLHEANNFPRLPVRDGEKLFVWFARVEDLDALRAAQAKLHGSAEWKALGAQLTDYEERPAQLLRLAPTPKSRLR